MEIVMSDASDDEFEEGLFLDERDVEQVIDLDDEQELPDADDEDEAEDDEEDDKDDETDEEDDEEEEEGSQGELYAVTCSPTDATLVATGGKDEKGFLWKIGQGDFALTLQGHADSVTCLAFSSDGQLLASGCRDGNIMVWNVTSGSRKCTLECPGGQLEWVRWHPRKHVVLAGSKGFDVFMWSADGIQNVLSGHGGGVLCGDFTPNGKFICTGSKDATLRIWDSETAQCIHTVRGYPYHTKRLRCLTISPDSTLALTGSKDASAHIVNIITGKVVTSLIGHTNSILCAGFSASGPWAATGGMDDNLIIWDLQTSSARSTCVHEDGVTCLLWLGRSRFVATGCVDGRVRIWDSRCGDCVRTFSGHTGEIQAPHLCLSRIKQHASLR